MKRSITLLIVFLGVSVSAVSVADWLQDMTNQAQQDLKLQGQRATGGGTSGPQSPRGGGGGGGQGMGSWPGGSGYKPGPGGAAQIQDWKVFCRAEGLTSQTRNNGSIHTGEQYPWTGRYILMRGGFPSDAAARNWISQNCSSWRCDWNGRCVTQGTPWNIDEAPVGGGLFGQ
jgi:hypothetical protein